MNEKHHSNLKEQQTKKTPAEELIEEIRVVLYICDGGLTIANRRLLNSMLYQLSVKDARIPAKVLRSIQKKIESIRHDSGR